jgi:hypothetical protein
VAVRISSGVFCRKESAKYEKIESVNLHSTIYLFMYLFIYVFIYLFTYVFIYL